MPFVTSTVASLLVGETDIDIIKDPLTRQILCAGNGAPEKSDLGVGHGTRHPVFFPQNMNRNVNRIDYLTWSTYPGERGSGCHRPQPFENPANCITSTNSDIGEHSQHKC